MSQRELEQLQPFLQNKIGLSLEFVAGEDAIRKRLVIFLKAQRAEEVEFLGDPLRKVRRGRDALFAGV